MQKIFFPSGNVTIAGNIVMPYKNCPAVLILHGGGNANKDRFADLQRRLLEDGIGSLAIDFRGVGESTGQFTDGSLVNRLQDANAAFNELQKYTASSHLAVLGASMGGFLAPLVATAHKEVSVLILTCPAAYSLYSENVPLGPDFTKAISKENSWEDSRSFTAVAKFSGKALVVYGEHDTVIPSGVQDRYRSLVGIKGEIVTIPNASHNLMVPRIKEDEKVKAIVLDRVSSFLQNNL